MRTKKELIKGILDECYEMSCVALDSGEGVGLTSYEIIAGVLNAMYMRDLIMSEYKDCLIPKEQVMSDTATPAPDNVLQFNKGDPKE